MTTLFDIRGLTKRFPVKKRRLFEKPRQVHAVDEISFTIESGETLGLVGESGSGKTTVGRLLLRALKPDAGEVRARFDSEVDLAQTEGKALRAMRPAMQMIFQDPYASLNPRMPVRDIIADPLIAMGLARGREVDAQVIEMAERCQLEISHLRRFPHAFSGGQRQRIGIARALVTKPKFVVCDEAVSALDLSIRAEILNLLAELRDELGLTYLFISHDLGVVQHITTRVAVMYLGELVEIGPTAEVFASPLHPYTRSLMSAIPQADPTRPMQPVALEGEMPDPMDPPEGCRFRTRCAFATDRCRAEKPALVEQAPGHFAACHFADIAGTARP